MLLDLVQMTCSSCSNVRVCKKGRRTLYRQTFWGDLWIVGFAYATKQEMRDSTDAAHKPCPDCGMNLPSICCGLKSC